MRLPNACFFDWVEAELAAGRRVRIRMKGNSMRPLLRSGVDEVVISPRGKEALRSMDIVLFRYAGRHILHRIVKIEAGSYWIQGDGVWLSHEECEVEAIVGVVRKVIRGGREMDTDAFLWRAASRLWRMLGKGGRGFCLRLMNRIGRWKSVFF